MATKSLCSIPDCGKPHKARGYCKAHYRRWQMHGDPLAGSTPYGEPARYLDDVVLAHELDECLTWPYAKSTKGYGKIGVNGRSLYVHRLVCEILNGPAPSSSHQAAHSCGNGHRGCVNPRHLSWKTRHENMADTFVHGTHNRGERSGRATITEDQARKILSLKGTMTKPEIAKEVGASYAVVTHILFGDRWQWLSE